MLGELRTGLSGSAARRGFSANQGCVLIRAQKCREQRLAGAASPGVSRWEQWLGICEFSVCSGEFIGVNE